VKKSKKRAVSLRSSGAPDSEQYMFGVHRIVRCVAESLSREACNQGLSDVVAQDYLVCTGQSGQWSDPMVECYRPQRLADVARAPDMYGVHQTVRCARRQKQQLFCPTTIIEGSLFRPLELAIWWCGSPSNIPIHVVDIFKCSNT
jgi:hypothetical protein